MAASRQLFRVVPDIEVVNRLLQAYNLESLNDSKQFSKYDLTAFKTVDKVIELIPELTLYYVPCKSYIYLQNINEKRCITILKHFVTIYNYKVSRREVVKNTKKIIYYHLEKKDDVKMKITFESDKRTVSFD